MSIPITKFNPFRRSQPKTLTKYDAEVLQIKKDIVALVKLGKTRVEIAGELGFPSADSLTKFGIRMNINFSNDHKINGKKRLTTRQVIKRIKQLRNVK